MHDDVTGWNGNVNKHYMLQSTWPVSGNLKVLAIVLIVKNRLLLYRTRKFSTALYFMKINVHVIVKVI